MKRTRKLVVASSVLVLTAAIPQNLPLNFGTPEGTNALAASAGFLDILEIKLGMPAEAALAALKRNYPASRITLARTGDYESAWYTLERENPNHKWVYKIDVEPNGPGDKISVGFSLPPSRQVVHSVGRDTFFKEPVAVENILVSLRKKYGQETYGVDYKLGAVAPFDGSEKQFLWIFDAQGNRVKPEAVTKNATTCAVGISGDMGAAPLTLGTRPYEAATLKMARAGPSWSCMHRSTWCRRPRALPAKHAASRLLPSIGRS